MWLPREERQLLMFYAVYDADLHGNPMEFSVKELGDMATGRLCARQIAKCAERIKGANGQTEQESVCDSVSSNGSAAYMKWLHAKGVIESADSRLQNRGLIGFRECGTGYYEVTLKPAGWDLGRKYNSWWDGTGLWYKDKIRHHWVVPVAGFVAGVLSTLVVQCLSN